MPSGNGIIEGERVNEGHVGVRFGDHRIEGIKILLDGIDITNDTHEAIPGSPGVAVMVSRPFKWEPSPWVLVFGNVVVEQCLT